MNIEQRNELRRLAGEAINVPIAERVDKSKEGHIKHREAKRALRRVTHPAAILALLDALDRKDALLREALSALKYHTDQTRPIQATKAAMAEIEKEFGL